MIRDDLEINRTRIHKLHLGSGTSAIAAIAAAFSAFVAAADRLDTDSVWDGVETSMRSFAPKSQFLRLDKNVATLEFNVAT